MKEHLYIPTSYAQYWPICETGLLTSREKKKVKTLGKRVFTIWPLFEIKEIKSIENEKKLPNFYSKNQLSVCIW